MTTLNRASTRDVKMDLSTIGKDNKFVTPSSDPYLEYYAEYFQLFGRESPMKHKELKALLERGIDGSPFTTLSAVALLMRPE
jgi:hypothetical protein